MTAEKKNKKKMLIAALVACFVIAGVIAGATLTKDTEATVDKDLKAGEVEIVNEDGEVEVVKEDSKAAEEYEEAVASGEREEVKAAKKSESKSSKTSSKTESKKSDSSASSSKDKNSSGSSSSSSSSSKDKETTASKHTHNWVAVYKEVDNGYYKTVTERVHYNVCKACNIDITGVETSHQEAHALKGEKAGTKSAYRYVETQVWVSNIEKVVDYYKCSCGATK